MANLLRNKAVVSCLVIIAALGVAANLLKFPFRTRVLAATLPVATEAAAAEEKFQVPPPLSVRPQLLVWSEAGGGARPARDPFAWPALATPVSTNALAEPAPAFRLQAVSIEQQKVFAVL